MKKLKHGLHVAIVTSSSAGHGGSLFAWETYMTCNLKGIPAILATFEQSRLYPEIGDSLRRLSLDQGESIGNQVPDALCSLLSIAEEAKSENKLLIIDTKSGFKSNDIMFKVLTRAGIGSATSVAALMPLQYGHEPHFGDFESHGIRMTRGLFRHWGFKSTYPDIAFAHTPPLYHWIPAFLTAETLESILSQRQHHQMPKEVEDEIGDLVYFPDSDDQQNQYLRHLDDAASNIWISLLDPITESVWSYVSPD